MIKGNQGLQFSKVDSYSGLHKYVPIEKPFLFSVSIHDLG